MTPEELYLDFAVATEVAAMAGEVIGVMTLMKLKGHTPHPSPTAAAGHEIDTYAIHECPK